MALFKILKGDSSRISTDITPFHDGYAYFTSDDGGFYIDVENNGIQTRTRVQSPSMSSEQYTVTFSNGAWTSSGGYYKQTKTVTGLAASYAVSPDIDVSLSGTDSESDASLIDAFSLVSVAQTATNSLTLLCCGDPPEINLPVTVRVFK